MKYIKKYEINLELLSKQNSKDITDLIVDVLKDYFLEGSVKKIEKVKMTKEEIDNWIDFDEEEE